MLFRGGVLVVLLVALCLLACGLGEHGLVLGKEEDAAADTAAHVKEEPKKKKKKGTEFWSKLREADLEKEWEKGDAAEELEHEYDHSQKVAEKKQRDLLSGRAQAARAKKEKFAKRDAAKKMKKEQQKKMEQSPEAVAARASAAEIAAKMEAAKAETLKTHEEAFGPNYDRRKATQKKSRGRAANIGNNMPAFDPTDEAAVRAQVKAQVNAATSKLGGKSKSKSKGRKVDPTASLNANTGTAMYFIDLHPTQVDGKEQGKAWTKAAVDELARYWTSMLHSAHLGSNIYNLGANNKEGQMLVSVDRGWQTRDILKFVCTQPSVRRASKDHQHYTGDMFRDDDDDDAEL